MIRVIRPVAGIVALGMSAGGSASPRSASQSIRVIEAETAAPLGGASIKATSRDSVMEFSHSGQGLEFHVKAAARKLSIRYASAQVGTLSVSVNDGAPRIVNVHSSGSVSDSFLHAVIEIAIPRNAKLTIRLNAGDGLVAIDRIILGNGNLGLPPDIWNLSPLPIASGPYVPDWRQIAKRYSAPQWWRDAKFGAWSHWDPQSIPEQGDWYSRGMYMEGSRQYRLHLERFGHPSQYGYKDVCNNWVVDRWDAEGLMNLYTEMGARYFMAMGVHHDNFDCWDSAYQPWNSVRVGPKVDIVGTWSKVARRHGMRFGIGFHNTPARTWGQFMPVRYVADKQGTMKGVPYDALQSIQDGKGKWWNGLDPVDLYGPPHTPNDPLHSPFANQFMWRVDDAITKYHPDVIYFDEHAGDSQVDLGVQMGLGFLAPQLAANYYNKSLKWHRGKMEAVLNLKGVGGRWNSFQNHPDLLPFVDRSLVKSSEFVIEPEIMAYPFQTETSISDWHYQTGQSYMEASKVVDLLMQNVCRNGTMLLNLTQHGRGDLDAPVVRIAKDVGAWLKINGEAVYGSRPFEVFGEKSVCYTRNNGNVYATLLDWKGGPITLPSLRSGGATLGRVTRVEMLGVKTQLAFVQDERGLTVTPVGSVPSAPGIADSRLATECRALRIVHDKGWVNDDDPGFFVTGWTRECNLKQGDYNNDLTISDTPGESMSYEVTGRSVKIIAPKSAGAGKIEVQVDGRRGVIVDLNTTGPRQSQQVVFQLNGMRAGKHRLKITNRGSGPVAIDALTIGD